VQNISKSYQRILTEVFAGVGRGRRNDRLDFGADPDTANGKGSHPGDPDSMPTRTKISVTVGWAAGNQEDHPASRTSHTDNFLQVLLGTRVYLE